MPHSVTRGGLCRLAHRTAAGCVLAGSLQVTAFCRAVSVPEGTFKELTDETLGDALLIHDRQLFIDDYVVDELAGARQVLQQPVKHPENPIIRRDRPGEQEPTSSFAYGAVLHDPRDRLFKMWYQIWQERQPTIGLLGYATSTDGVHWEKPVIDAEAGTNIVQFDPPQAWVAGAGVVIDAAEPDADRRFKMMYLAQPTLKSASRQSCLASLPRTALRWRRTTCGMSLPGAGVRTARSCRGVRFDCGFICSGRSCTRSSRRSD